MVLISASNGRTKKRRAKQSLSDKALRRDRLSALTGELDGAKENYDEKAQEIAKNYDRSVGWTRNQLHLTSKLLKRRTTNPWNGFVSDELRKFNADRGTGEKYRLPQYISEFKDQLQTKWSTLTVTDRLQLTARVNEIRASRKRLVRKEPAAILKDFNSSFKSMDIDWTAMHLRCEMQGFYVAVRGNIEHHNQAKVFSTDKASRFLTQILGVDPRRLALKLESYVISDLSGVGSIRGTKADEVSECRKLIQGGLPVPDDLLDVHRVKHKPPMNYDNYELVIVECLGVELKGYPFDQLINPGKITKRGQVQNLLKLLETGTCRWVKLTESELEERKVANKAREASGEVVYKRRKTKQPVIIDGETA